VEKKGAFDAYVYVRHARAIVVGQETRQVTGALDLHLIEEFSGAANERAGYCCWSLGLAYVGRFYRVDVSLSDRDS